MATLLDVQYSLCSSLAIMDMAGPGHNRAISASHAVLGQMYSNGEGFVVAESRREWVKEFDKVASGARLLLSSTVAAIAAQDLMAADSTGYLNSEVELKMDYLKDKAARGLAILKIFKSNDMKGVLD